MEVAMAAEAVGVFGGGAGGGGGEEVEVPVFGDVPIEGVEGVEEDGEEPGLGVSWDGQRGNRGLGVG